jgi:hypothetical protein
MARQSDFESGGTTGVLRLTGPSGLLARDLNTAWWSKKGGLAERLSTPSNPEVRYSTDARAVRDIMRAVFVFDFTERGEGQGEHMHNIKKIREATISLTTTSVAGSSKIRLCAAPLFNKPIASSADLFSARAAHIKGYDVGRSRGTYEIKSPFIANADANVDGTGRYKWELPATIFPELKRALKAKSFFAVVAMDFREMSNTLASGIHPGLRPGGSETNSIVFAGFGGANAPKIDVKYDLDLKRIHQGAGAGGTSAAGFGGTSLFCGSNAGFG